MPSFATLVFLALCAGAAFGFVAPHTAASLRIVGDLFLAAIGATVLPVVLCCVAAGVAQMGSTRTLGKVGGTVVIYSLVVNLCSAAAGILCGVLFDPAKGIALVRPHGASVAAATLSGDAIIRSLVPDNIFAALANNNVTAVVVFAILLGVSMLLSGDAGKPLLSVLQSASEVFGKMVGIIIRVTPIAVFCVMAVTISEYGLGILGGLAKLVAVVWVGTTLFLLLWTIALCTFLLRISWRRFLESNSEAFLMGLATCSGVATLPLNVANTTKYFGVPRDLGVLVIGSGTVITNGGSSFYKAIAAYFLATLYGVPLSLGALGLIIFLSAVVVTAGVPATGTLTIIAILNALGVPLDGIALLLGIDRLRDMIATAGNVLTQSLAAITVYRLVKVPPTM